LRDVAWFIRFNIFSQIKKLSYLFFLFSFMLIAGFLFFEYVDQTSKEVLNWNEKIIAPVLGNLHFLFMIFIPIITYITSSLVFSDEGRKLCCFLELTPISWQISNYLFCLFQVLLLHVLIFPFVFYIFHLGYDDWSFFSNLSITLFLISSCLCTISFFIRSKVKSPLVFILFYIFIFCFFYLIGLGGNYVNSFVLIEFFKSISFSVIFDSALSGLFSFKNLFYLITVSASFFYMSLNFSEKRG